MAPSWPHVNDTVSVSLDSVAKNPATKTLGLRFAGTTKTLKFLFFDAILSDAIYIFNIFNRWLKLVIFVIVSNDSYGVTNFSAGARIFELAIFNACIIELE